MTARMALQKHSVLLPALPEAKRPEVIPGIEFSTEYLGSDIHIVGLDMQYQAPEFQATVASFRDDRLIRNKKMIARMAADHIDISYEEMAKAYGEQVWTRAHFAGYLVAHGYVASRKEAFASLIGEGCRYYVPRSRIRPEEAVDLIRRFDGIPILAHPLLYHYDDAGLRTLARSAKGAWTAWHRGLLFYPYTTAGSICRRARRRARSASIWRF